MASSFGVLRQDEGASQEGKGKSIVGPTDPLTPATMRTVSDGSEAIISAMRPGEPTHERRRSARRGLFLLFGTAAGNLMLNRLVPGSSDHNRHDLEKLQSFTGLARPVYSGGRHHGRCHA